MKPDTVHWIAQGIKGDREWLTRLESFLQKQEKSHLRDELFRYINLERKALKEKEDLLFSRSS